MLSHCVIFAFILLGTSALGRCGAEVPNAEDDVLKALLGVFFDDDKETGKNETLQRFVCFQDIGCFYRNGTFDHLAHLPDPPEKIQTRFFLYPAAASGETVVLDYLDPSTLATPAFRPGSPTKILVHGFNQASDSHLFVQLKDALLKKDPGANVIIADWWRGARGPFYLSAAVNSEVVGRQTARLLYLLAENRGLDVGGSVHIIGFSLGAQAAGFAGRWLLQQYGLKLNRISGLDPASPFFEGYGPRVHLTAADASFVDVIHTSAGGTWTNGEVGFMAPIGHVDFFPNGGKSQPQCTSGLKCNHHAAMIYYIQSVNGTCDFRAYPCRGGYEAFSRGQCFTCSPCGTMGYNSAGSLARGSFYLATRTLDPLCGTYVSIYLQSSFRQERTYGDVWITLEGPQGRQERLHLTSSDEQQILPGEELASVHSVNPAVFPIRRVFLNYQAFKGWITKGADAFGILALHAVEESRAYEFHSCAETDISLPSGQEVELNYGGCS